MGQGLQGVSVQADEKDIYVAVQRGMGDRDTQEKGSSKYVKDTGSPVPLSEKELRNIGVLGSNVNCKYNVTSYYNLNPIEFKTLHDVPLPISPQSHPRPSLNSSHTAFLVICSFQSQDFSSCCSLCLEYCDCLLGLSLRATFSERPSAID